MKNQLKTISVAIATYNEENNIAKCLEAVVDWVDEIIIADGTSQDKTIEIASKFKNVKIIKTTNKPIFHLNKNIAIDGCTSDWILQLDADEIVTPELKNEIISYLKKDIDEVKENAFWIPRKNYFLGAFLKKGGQYPDPTIRFYKNGKGRLPCVDVHEQAKIEGEIGWLKNDLEHYADTSFSKYLLRHNRYTTLLAQELQQKNTPINFISFLNFYLFKPLWWFLKTFFRHRGYVDGFPGFVFSFYSALRFPIMYTKYWELVKTNRKIDLKNDWDKK
ncbi:MAG: glycosyltransferase family 2 protein [Candidatus Shapirobacteria bacterium]|nr:glycosyltransferase family 2 protein [Candidatus Shapirobacteria bacterium]MDD4410544.1 glycosyltransferase family 2 protein [Candidatus Shapirobacteria bacterium]